MQLGDRTLDLRQPLLVGIVNLTPDSFSDGGELDSLDAILRRAAQLIADGADILDVGGESSRPGAAEISVDMELSRVVAPVEAIARRFDVPISIDTRRAAVAAATLGAGATMVNDISGFSDPLMGKTVAAHAAAWVLMHTTNPLGQMNWTERAPDMPETVDGALRRICAQLRLSVERARAAGVPRTQLCVDPGIGFGKSLGQNLALLRSNSPLASLNVPLYFGPSRKSFIAALGRAAGRQGAAAGEQPLDRIGGTAAAVVAAVQAGASFIRVHDVAVMRQVIDMTLAIADKL